MNPLPVPPPPPTTTSRLLLLPGEIRNAIYAYAFAQNHGIWYQYDKERRIGQMFLFTHDRRDLTNEVRTSQHPHHSQAAFLEANQLKFVNHQLCAETRGLVLRYNDLMFRNVEELAIFLRTCDTSHYSRFRVFNVVTGSIFDLATLRFAGDEVPVHAVFDFCRQAPHVLVRHISMVDFSKMAFFGWAIRLEVAARRGVAIMQTLVPSQHGQGQVMRIFLTKAGLGSLADVPGNAPSNFRFFPRMNLSEEQSVQAFRHAYENDSSIRGMIHPHLEGRLDRWLDVMRRAIRFGI
jgi:hypothetical protein